jgi:hypothetical protein
MAIAVRSLKVGEARVDAAHAFRLALAHAGPLSGVLLRVVGIPLVLALTVVGLPFALWYLGRSAVAVPACVIEELDRRAAMARSKELVGRHFLRVGLLTSIVFGCVLLIGPLVGATLLLLTGLPFAVNNLIALAISSAALPVGAVVITLLFFDLRVRALEATSEHRGRTAPTTAPRHPQPRPGRG